MHKVMIFLSFFRSCRCDIFFGFSLKRWTDIDGAYFGTTFPHLFLMTYGHLKPPKATQNYVQRVFGFKLHKPWRKFKDKKPRNQDHGFGLEKRKKRDVCVNRNKKKNCNFVRWREHSCLYLSSGTYTLEASKKLG